MSEEQSHLEDAKKLCGKAVEEFEIAREKSDSTHLSDACAKAWLSVIEAVNALLIKKGMKGEELPKTDRGRRYMVFKHSDRELRHFYLALRESFHVEGYYDRTLGFDEMKEYLNDLMFILYIHKL